MRGHVFLADQDVHLRLIQAVSHFVFPSGIQPIHPPRGFWALSAVTNFDLRYRTGTCRGPWRQRPRNSLVLFAPHCRWQEDTPPHRGTLTSAWLTFSIGDDRTLLALCNADGVAECHDPQHRVIRLIQRCADVCERYKDQGFLAGQAVLYQIVHRLLGAQRDRHQRLIIGRPPRQSPTNKLVQTVRAYLRTHVHAVIRLDDLAAACGVSVSTVSHRYREFCGESPLQTQAHMRMAQARQLLLMGHSVASIAERLGYADIYHFSKSFKKLEGRSPLAFVRAYRD